MSQVGDIKRPPGGFGSPVSPRTQGGTPGGSDKPGGGSGGVREEKTQIGRMPTQVDMPRAGGGREEKTQIGRMPTRADMPRAGAGEMREEKTQIGRMPTQVDTPRAGASAGAAREEKTSFWKFSEDGLENRTETRTTRSREDKGGVFEGPRTRESSRGTGERQRLPSRTQDGSGFNDRQPVKTGERPQLPRRTETQNGTGFNDRPQARTGERPQLPRGAETQTGTGFNERAPVKTGERPQLPRRTEDGAQKGTGFNEQSPVKTGERPQVPKGTGFQETTAPKTGEKPQVEGAEGGTGFEELSTQAHEGAEGGAVFEQHPAGPKTGSRPQLPTRPAEAPRQGKAELPTEVPVPTPGTPEPTEGAELKPLEDLLPTFSESIGQESLAHHFGEELRFQGPNLRPSQLPPSERTARLWAFFIAYAEANAKDPAGQSPAGQELFRQELTKGGFGAMRDAVTGRNGVEVALDLLEAQSPEELQAKLADIQMEPMPEMLPSEVSIPVEHQPALAQPPKAETPKAEAPTAETVAAQAQKPEEQLLTPSAEARPEKPTEQAKATQAPLDQKELEQPVANLPKNAPPQGPLVPPGMIPPGQARADELTPEEAWKSRERGTNKRLGANMLWNALHGLRDTPEDSAVLQEQWNQVAFGAIIAFVGVALLAAMLASL